MADRELDKVASYMVHIAETHADFQNINHKVRLIRAPVSVLFLTVHQFRIGSILYAACRRVRDSRVVYRVPKLWSCHIKAMWQMDCLILLPVLGRIPRLSRVERAVLF